MGRGPALHPARAFSDGQPPAGGPEAARLETQRLAPRTLRGGAAGELGVLPENAFQQGTRQDRDTRPASRAQVPAADPQHHPRGRAAARPRGALRSAYEALAGAQPAGSIPARRAAALLPRPRAAAAIAQAPGILGAGVE